jgi:NAD(P)-dependent dehydrogenase (short-subunit alcohol dehydrogenase family)
MAQTLLGKRILVTGASADSDIGLAICQCLAAAGAQLILVGRREAQLAETRCQLPGSEHVVAPFDLTQLATIVDWLKELTSLHGPLEGLVHSASFQGYSPLRSIKPTTIQSYFDINFSAAVMLLSALTKSAVASDGASVVMVSSAAGKRGLKARCLYAASKAALLSLTKSAALELADRGIRVNAVIPAIVAGSKSDKQFAMLGEQLSRQLVAQHPLGLSTPEDVAKAVCFLLSDESRRMTGSEFTVDGGFLAS